MTFVDYDHDGDLDLFVTGKRSSGVKDSTDNVLWRNNGNGTFTNWTKEAGLAGEGATTSVVLSDINNDRAVDLVVTGSSGAPTVYLNQREGPFKAMPLYDAAGLAADDRASTSSTSTKTAGWTSRSRTRARRASVCGAMSMASSFERVPLPITDATQGWGITAIDFDNDGWIDLAAVVETAKGAELRVFRNKGAQGFEDVSASLGLDKLKLHDPRALIAADLDDDLAADLVVTQLGGDPVVLHNEGGNKNHALRIDFKGLADNKTGLGTKVEVFANGTWQKFEVAGGAGYLSQGPPEILAGLGKNTSADIVRMLWPTGVLQDEIDVAVEQAGVVPRTRPARQFVSDAVCLEWREVRVHHRRDRRGRDRPLDFADLEEHARSRRVGQDRRLEAARQRRLPERALRRADGGSQLHRPAAHGRGRSSGGYRRVSRRALPRRSAVRQRQDGGDFERRILRRAHGTTRAATCCSC